MPTVPHTETHFLASASVRDVVIGMSDGLTVPFALAAGLSGAIASTNIIVTAGLAEVAAGALAMGLGGFLAARTDIEHYRAEYGREMRETVETPEEERREVHGIFQQYGLGQGQADAATRALTQDRERWVRFMMRFELGLEEPDPKRALRSALTIGGAYIAGGLIPLLPYMLQRSVQSALPLSILLTVIALFVFGAVKGKLTGVHPLRGGGQTVLVGGVAAAVAFAIARLVSG